MNRVTITPRERREYQAIGNRLVQRKSISGFQLEDFNPNQSSTRLIYAHDTPSHLRRVNKVLQGKVYPRESYYRWHASWKPGKNTQLFFNKTLANAKEQYVETPHVSQSIKFILSRTVKGQSKPLLRGSWVVPDVRIYDANKRPKYFKKAYQVTKNIDRDSRFSTIVTQQKKLEAVEGALRGEKVRTVYIQKFKKPNSLWAFINKS